MQNIFDIIDPDDSGIELADILNDFKNSLMTGLSGTSRPTELDAGGGWIDMTNDPTEWSYKIYTGSVDVEVFKINLSTGLASVALAVDAFLVKKVSADTAGALLRLVKNRIATNGQVLDGDTVGEIRWVGRTDTSDNPVVATIKWVSSDNQTSTVSGGTLEFYSTPDGVAAASLHMRLIAGLFETVVPHKVNARILVSQNVATTATIVQLSADKMVVEMTGSTATDIQGIKSDDDSQEVTIHNRSTAVVTLKHQNVTAASADRLVLPNDSDYLIAAQASATLYYCTTDGRWKLKSTSSKVSGATVETLYGGFNQWVGPSNVTAISLRAYRRMPGMSGDTSVMIDPFVNPNAYAWGINTNGQLGVGDVNARSSPVAVLGGLNFMRIRSSHIVGSGSSNYGINQFGNAYAWGYNGNGQLGLSDVVARSSPVAVTGGLKFANLYPVENSCFGIAINSAAYSWGLNSSGHLGVGDVTARSTPVAVLGGLKWARLWPVTIASGTTSVLGLTPAGAMYGWGYNVNGQLGLGDVTPRSSPVAVLGGLSVQQIGGGSDFSSRLFYTALTTAGAAYAWGNNVNGQLGVGDVTVRSSPIAVLGGLTFRLLVTHPKSETVFALTSSGGLYGWGANAQGQLGLGDALARSSPVAVLGGLTFSKVRLYKSTVFGLTNDGTAYAWGNNANGQLGVGDVVSRSSPVAVLGGLKFADIFFSDGITDNYSIFGVQADGSIYSWGANANGTLGLGDVTPRSSPVAVLGGLVMNTQEIVTSLDLTVTAGTTYTVILNNTVSTFAGTPLGLDIYKLEIEYT